MNRAKRWELPGDRINLPRVFEAAKEASPQLVFDAEGLFTVTYEKRGPEGSAREFLSSGGPDDE